MSQEILQEFAPDAILRAGLDTVSWACIHARNQSLKNDFNRKEFNDLMEAIHEVPRMLMRWDSDRLREIRIHLGCYPSDQFPGAPDLVKYFDQRLIQYTQVKPKDFQPPENL